MPKIKSADHLDDAPTSIGERAMSGKAAHTKGPWKLEVHHRQGRDRLVSAWYIKDANNVGIATQPSFSDPESESPNAHLIAAAPELYEALEEASNLTEGQLETPCVMEAEWSVEERNLVAKWRAILSKARGE